MPGNMATDPQITHVNRRASPRRPLVAAQAALREQMGVSLLLFAAVLALFWATRTQYNTFDAVSYADQIAHLYPRTHKLTWLFHPHHLLFNATGYGLWRLSRALGYRGGPLVVLESLNAFLGAGGIVLFYLTLRWLMQRSRWLPLITASGLALTFGYWATATDGRVNMPSTMLLLGAFYALCTLMESPRPGRAAVLGLLAGAAVLFHESAGLFVPVGLVGIALAEMNPMLLPAERERRRRGLLLTYLGAWLATVIIPYTLVGGGLLGLHSPQAFHAWSSAYSELGWWWSFHIAHNLRLDFYALRHAAFVEPAGTQGTFHIGPRVSGDLAALYWATLAGWFVAVYAFFAALPLLWRGHHRQLMIVCLVWIGLYAAFFTIWSPGYFVFWVPVLAPISILVALALAHYRARRGSVWVNWLVGAWIILFATLNVEASIRPHLRPNASPFAVAARDIRAHTLPGDVVLLAGAGDGAQCEVDIPYFADREVVSLHGLLTRAHENKTLAWNAASAQMAQTTLSRHTVYALDELWHNKRTGDALARRHPAWTHADLVALCAPYRRTLAWVGPRGPVWRLTPLMRILQTSPDAPAALSSRSQGAARHEQRRSDFFRR